MPREFNTIQRPDLIFRLQQFFGIRQSSVTPTLSPTVQAVVIVADLQNAAVRPAPTAPVFPMICSGEQVRGPTAGQFAKFQLRNPLNSGVLISVDDIHKLATGTSYTLGLSMFQNVDFGSVVIPTVVETIFRAPGSGTINPGLAIPPKGVLSGETSAVLEPIVQFGNLASSTIVTNMRKPFCVLAPGDAFLVQSIAQNLGDDLTVRWTETPISS